MCTQWGAEILEVKQGVVVDSLAEELVVVVVKKTMVDEEPAASVVVLAIRFHTEDALLALTCVPLRLVFQAVDVVIDVVVLVVEVFVVVLLVVVVVVVVEVVVVSVVVVVVVAQEQHVTGTLAEQDPLKELGIQCHTCTSRGRVVVLMLRSEGTSVVVVVVLEMFDTAKCATCSRYAV